MAAYNTPLTLTSLQAYVRNYVLERTGDNGLITDTELTDIINAASRLLWLRIATKYPDVFMSRTASNKTVTAGGNLPFATLDANGANIFRVVYLAVGPVGATPDKMNPLNEFDRVTFRHIYESYITTQVPPATPYRFYVENKTVFFTPTTSGSFDVIANYIYQPQDMTAGSDQLWGGLLPMYHDAVAILASLMVFSKDGNLNSGFQPIFQYIDAVLTENFGPPMDPMDSNPKETRP